MIFCYCVGFSDSLKIGDFVYLRDVNLGCYLSVEGIISEDLVGVRTIKDLQDSLFCIHLQRQYSAYRELNVFLEGYGMDKSKITDEGELSYYQALEVPHYDFFCFFCFNIKLNFVILF